MHPPDWHPHHRLSDWPDCVLEIKCGCGRTVCPPIKLVRSKVGDPTFADLAARLRCEACGARPAPVYLVAGHYRDTLGGIDAQWAVLVVKTPK